MLSPSRGVVGGVGYNVLYSLLWSSFHPKEWVKKESSSALLVTWNGLNLVHNTL